MGGPCYELLQSGEERELVELDNFYTAAFMLDGKEWRSSEHYYQASKFPAAPEIQERIRLTKECSGADGCYLMGQQSRSMLRKDWNLVKVEVMYRANKAKFQSNSDLAAILCSTKGRLRALGNENEWATWNAILLERIREELRPNTDRDTIALNLRVSIMQCLSDVQRLLLKSLEEGSGEGIFERHLTQAVTMLAAKREDPRDLLEHAPKQCFNVTGCDATLGGPEGGNNQLATWVDGRWFVDPIKPFVNGELHLVTGARHDIRDSGEYLGGHMYCGQRREKSAWVIDNRCDSEEVGGMLTLPVTELSKTSSSSPADVCPLAETLPLLGNNDWLFYDGRPVALRISLC